VNKRIERDEVNKGGIEGKKKYPKRDKTQYSNKMRFDVVVVLGMHRSGTSALTKGLELFGINLGSNVLGPGPDNTKGYFEDAELVQINDRILAKGCSHWSSIQFLKKEFLTGSALDAERLIARRWLQAKVANGKPVGLKDPRLCRTLPFWEPLFAEARLRVGYVLAIRAPMEIAASLQKRNGFGLSYGVDLWAAYMSDALRNLEGRAWTAAGFSQLLEDPRRELARLAGFLGADWDPASPAVTAYEKEFLDPSLRHHRSAEAFPQEFSSYKTLASKLEFTCGDGKASKEEYLQAAQGVAQELEPISRALKTNNVLLFGEFFDHQVSLELFFALEPGAFTEERKISEKVSLASGARREISLKVTEAARKAPFWRIDPGFHAGKISLHDLKFLDASGRVLWDLAEQREKVFVGGTAAPLPLPNHGLELVSTGNDPLLILPPLPEGVQVASIRLVVVMAPVADGVEALARVQAAQQRTLHQQLESGQAQVAQLEGQLKVKKQEVQDLRSITGEVKKVRVETAKLGDSLAGIKQELEAQKVATSKGVEELGDSLVGLKQELEAQKVATSKGVKELGDSLVGLKEELIHELRGLVGGLNERQDQLQQRNLAEMDTLRTSLVDRQRESENNLLEVAKYAEQIQDSVIAPSSYLIPAPFSWYSHLYKMLQIKKPNLLNKTSGAAPKRPGFWRRLERSIRKRRKMVQLAWSRLFFDESWYMKNNVDVEKSGMNAWEHYTQFGRAEGRFGSKRFYQSRYPLPMKLWILLQDNWFFAKIPRLQHELIKYSFLNRTTHLNSLDKKANYQHWWRLRAYFDVNEIVQIKKAFSEKSAKPVISVLLPVFNPDPMFLKKAITSVLRQSYPDWELCIADDKSTDPEIKRIINFYRAQDNRIKVIFREKNGHISRASNSALELAKGEYVALLDHDDELAKDALLWVANELQKYPNACLVYSDEDKIDRQGERHEPYFKPDFNWTLFWSQNLITHLAVLKTSVVKELGGFRAGYEGSQDYDLFLRVVEQVGEEHVRHIPRVLYHWREHNLSTAASGGAKPYALVASVKAVNESLARQGISAKVEPQESFGVHRFYGLFKNKKPRCSVIIPTRNAGDLVTVCVESLFKITDYPDIEVILVDNESDDQKSLRAFEALRKKFRERFLILPCPGSFNFSRINNHAVQFASGPLICLLNNDTEVLNAEWMSEMAWFASRREIGAVGAKLLYPSGEIQHAGVVLGIGGVAGHAFCHSPGNSLGYFNRAILPSEFSAVTAACLMVEKKKYLEVDGLDETNLKVAFNDTDFCLKLRARGYRNVLNPYAILRHHESKTRGLEDNPQKLKRFNDETNMMKDRWQENLRNDPCYNPNLTLVSQDFSLESIDEIVVKCARRTPLN